MQPPDSRQGRWVSFDEARMILRKSEGTLRREIKAGKVEAASFPRNPDNPDDKRSIYRVLVQDPPAAATPTESEQAPPSAIQAPEALLPTLEALISTHERLYGAYREIADLRGQAASAEADANHEQARADDLAERLIVATRQHDADAETIRELRAELEAERARPWWRRLLR